MGIVWPGLSERCHRTDHVAALELDHGVAEGAVWPAHRRLRALRLAEDDLELFGLGTVGPLAFPRGTNLFRFAPNRRHSHPCRDTCVVRKVREVLVREDRLLLRLTRVRELLPGQLSVRAGRQDFHAIVDRPLRQMARTGLPSDLGPGPRTWMVNVVTARQNELGHFTGAVSEAGPLEEFPGLPPPFHQFDA